MRIQDPDFNPVHPYAGVDDAPRLPPRQAQVDQLEGKDRKFREQSVSEASCIFLNTGSGKELKSGGHGQELKLVKFEERDAMKKLTDPVMAAYAKEIGAEEIHSKIETA
jgi:hypothetical protein